MTALLNVLTAFLGKVLGSLDVILGFFAGRKVERMKNKEKHNDILKKQRDIANSDLGDPVDRMFDNEL